MENTWHTHGAPVAIRRTIPHRGVEETVHYIEKLMTIGIHCWAWWDKRKKKKRNRGHTRNQFPNPNPIVEVVGVKKLWKITRKRGHARRQFGICCESGLYLLFVELVASVARFYPFFRLPRASFTPANSKMDSNGHEFSTYNELLSPLPCFAESFDLKLPGTKGT